MLIEFSLRPVLEIEPWGTPGDLHLSWFGLTNGQYAICAGQDVLFQYSQYARALGAPQRCEYQVARLHEDILNIVPYVLEPVPASLVPYISGEVAERWREHFELWYNQNEGLSDNKRYWEVLEAATAWRSKRHVDSLYLSPPANISVWSDIQSVYIEWDNRNSLFDGHPAWTAIQGRHKMPRSLFIQEIESFHSRLMQEMNERVDQVARGALSTDIQIDVPGLKHEHERRCECFRNALNLTPHTDWLLVERAINEVSNAVKRPQP